MSPGNNSPKLFKRTKKENIKKKTQIVHYLHYKKKEETLSDSSLANFENPNQKKTKNIQ